MAGRPLEGVRVVELSTVIAGPATGGILANWGADVVRVEPPGGDGFRYMYKGTPGLEDSAPSQLGPCFYVDNHSKRAVELDLRDPDAAKAFEVLIERADVFVSNYRARALERLGLGPQALRARHPKLVVCLISGYGSTGPERDTAGYEMSSFWARSSAAEAFRPAGEDFVPLLAGGFGDHTTALAAVGGVVAALLRAQRTGVGAVVETSLLRTGMYANSWSLAYHMANGGEDVDDKQRPYTPVARHYGNPLSGLYKTLDGSQIYLIGAEPIRHWPATCAALGHLEWLEDPRFQYARGRREHGAVLYKKIQDALAKRTLSEWDPVLREHDIWFSKVQNVPEVVADPQAAPGLLELPPSDADRRAGHMLLRSVASPVDFDTEVMTARGPVPSVGEHTASVLKELGVADEIIRRLTAAARSRAEKLAAERAVKMGALKARL